MRNDFTNVFDSTGSETYKITFFYFCRNVSKMCKAFPLHPHKTNCYNKASKTSGHFKKFYSLNSPYFQVYRNKASPEPQYPPGCG